jgi:NADH-quinone oxidoreductase subunit G
VLHLLAAEMGIDLRLPDTGAAARELRDVGRAGSGVRRVPAPADPAEPAPVPKPGEAVLASWHQLVDDGALLADEPYLAGTARPARVRLSAATAIEIGVAPGDLVTVRSGRGSVTLPCELAAMPDRVVWVPTHSAGSHVRRSLAARAGVVVRIAAGGTARPAGVDTFGVDQRRGTALGAELTAARDTAVTVERPPAGSRPPAAGPPGTAAPPAVPTAATPVAPAPRTVGDEPAGGRP